MKRLLVLAVICLAIAGTRANADFITGVSAGAGNGVGGTLTGSSFGGGIQNNDVTTPGNPNFVNLSFDVHQLFSPFTVDFATQEFTSIFPAGGIAEYFFTVTITNALANPYTPIGPITISRVGNATLDAFSKTPTPTNSSGAPAYQPTAHTNTTIWFGGPAGGGGEIAPGDTATFTFSVDVSGTGFDGVAGPGFGLTFTANPEPGTIALAGLALGAGGVYIRRRRQQQIKAAAATA